VLLNGYSQLVAPTRFPLELVAWPHRTGSQREKLRLIGMKRQVSPHSPLSHEIVDTLDLSPSAGCRDHDSAGRGVVYLTLTFLSARSRAVPRRRVTLASHHAARSTRPHHRLTPIKNCWRNWSNPIPSLLTIKRELLVVPENDVSGKIADRFSVHVGAGGPVGR